MSFESRITVAFSELLEAAAAHSCVAGFCGETDTRNEAELIALIHSELSECLDALRHGNPPSEHIPEFSAVCEELADTVIRVCDYAGGRGHPLGEAIIAKLAFNKTRPHKHGKFF